MRTVGNLIQLGDIEKASGYLDFMKKMYGDNPAINSMYKQIYRAGKQYDLLENAIKNQLAADPNNPSLMIELGEARYLQNDTTSADSLWNHVLANYSQDEFIYRLLATCKLRYGLYDDAIDLFAKGRKTLAKPDLFSEDLSAIYEAQRNYPAAVGEYLSQLKANPGLFGIITIKIRGLAADSDQPDAIVDVLKRQIKENPKQQFLREILGDIYIKLGKMPDALECYRAMGADNDDDGQSLVSFASRCYDSKAFGTAISAIDEYFKISKKVNFRERAIFVKAMAQQNLGQADSALQNFLVLSRDALDYRIKDQSGFLAGEIYFQSMKNCDSALFVWNSTLKSARDQESSNKIKTEIALCYLSQNNIKSAKGALDPFNDGSAVNSINEKARFLIGEIALITGDYGLAVNTFKSMAFQNPGGDYCNEAVQQFNFLSLLMDDSSNFGYIKIYAEAMKAQLLNNYQSAGDLLSDESLQKSPVAEQALFYSAYYYFLGGESQKALDGFNKYIVKYADGLFADRAYLGLGDIYSASKENIPQAKDSYNKILESFPSGPVTEQARERLLRLEPPER